MWTINSIVIPYIQCTKLPLLGVWERRLACSLTPLFFLFFLKRLISRIELETCHFWWKAFSIAPKHGKPLILINKIFSWWVLWTLSINRIFPLAAPHLKHTIEIVILSTPSFQSQNTIVHFSAPHRSRTMNEKVQSPNIPITFVHFCSWVILYYIEPKQRIC